MSTGRLRVSAPACSPNLTLNYDGAMEPVVRRTAGREDEELSLAIYNEVWPLSAITFDEVESFKASTLAYSDSLAEVDGVTVGSAFVAIQPQRPVLGYGAVTVLEPYRRRRAGTALYRDLSAWCAERGLDAFEARMEADDEASLELVLRHGFTEIGRDTRMVLDLTTTDAPSLEAPPGIEIVTWAERPDLARGMYDVAAEAYPDVPGSGDDAMEPFEDWLAHDLRGSADRPEATFVALAGDEVVGYSKFFLTAAQPTTASHDMTGVKRAWRGRGVAGALKRASIAWAKANGFERLVTSNELRNEPIRRLNARLGYREAPGHVIVRGPLLLG